MNDSNKSKSKRGFPVFRRFGKQSISKNLTIGLLITVIVISATAISISFIIASRNASVQLEDKAEQFAISLSKILRTPLWNIDAETTKDIGTSYFINELIAKLKIVDSRGKVYFEMNKEVNAPLISRSKEVLHKDKLIGHVYISLTSSYYKEISRQFMWSITITILMNLISLFVIIRFLLRRYLQSPLNYFSEVVRNYGSGNYELAVLQAPAIEFQPFVTVLSEMGERITVQMAELQKSEEKYRILFESESDALFVVDPETLDILEENKAAVNLYGYSHEEFLRLKATNLSDEPKETEKAIKLDPKTEVPIRYHRKKDGTIFPVEITASEIFLHGRKVNISAIRDITERKQMQDELEQHREHLEEMVQKRTAELQSIVNSMAGREVRMAELKETIQKLRTQLEEAGQTPVADDPLKEAGSEK